MSAALPRVGLVGPLPPPPGGMANQTRQLARLLAGEGVGVEVVRTNAPYRPRVVGRLRGVRALFRLAPFAGRLWAVAGRVDVVHVMANSGWSWHLFAAPAVWIARLRGVPVVVNYRGGGAEEFLNRSLAWVRPTLRRADRVVVPSGFLHAVFDRFGVRTEIVPNVVDVARFVVRPADRAPSTDSLHLLVTRALEPVYDVATLLRCLALVHERRPDVRLTIAGDGPERASLGELAASLGLASCVRFVGSIDNDHIAELYARSDVFVNPSRVDNAPVSILEALCAGVPVVSTDVGGIPYLLEHDRTALLVPPGQPQAMADAILLLATDRRRAAALADAGRATVERWAWPAVRDQWFAVYGAVVDRDRARTQRSTAS